MTIVEGGDGSAMVSEAGKRGREDLLLASVSYFYCLVYCGVRKKIMEN